MPQHYFDLRTQSARGTDSIIADMMRHLHTRQHLGTALVVGAEPMVMLSAARKQWLRITRSIQTQRASTLNADKILKYTHTITHMHNAEFTLKTPHERPNALVFFRDLGNLNPAPPKCFTVYVNAVLSKADVEELLKRLPQDALIIDYAHKTPWAEFGLKPKAELEQAVGVAWQGVARFLEEHHIAIAKLADDPIRNAQTLDEALDALLAVSYPFLQTAGVFQRALELARPLRLSKTTREQYDALALLAHRTQALSSDAFRRQFLEVYNEDDSFFLLDSLFDLLTKPHRRKLACSGDVSYV